MAELFKVNAPVRKPLFEGVQGENEARSIQFDIEPWVTELGDGAVTATAKRSQDSQPYPVTVTRDGTTVTWKPTSTDTAFAGVGSFQLEYTVDDVLAKTCIWSTMVAPSLDPAGDPPDPYDNWLAEMRQIAADALQSEQNADTSAKTSEAWAVGQRGGVDVPSTDPTYENNSKYWAEQSLANQYGAFIVKSASGEIASFSDGADDVPMKSLNVTITPKQSGSGDPSPSNVRAITGWSTVGVNVSGKNMLDLSKYTPSKRENGITFTVNSDGTIKANGTASSQSQIYWLVPAEIAMCWAGLTLSGCPNLSGISIRIEKQLSPYTNYALETGNGVIVNEAIKNETGNVYVTCRVNQGATLNNAVFKPMIRPASDTDATYEPYTGHTTPVPLGQTVYRGTLDVGTGELTITHGGAVYNGSENWGAETQGGTTSFYIARQSDAQPVGQIQDGDVFTSICPVTIETWQAGKMRITSGYYNFLLGSALGISTAEQFKTYLASNPISLCYKLETPTTVQLTPAQVATLLGTNNVWSDAGSVEVEYRADPTLAYNELANVIVSLGGNL